MSPNLLIRPERERQKYTLESGVVVEAAPHGATPGTSIYESWREYVRVELKRQIRMFVQDVEKQGWAYHGNIRVGNSEVYVAPRGMPKRPTKPARSRLNEPSRPFQEPDYAYYVQDVPKPDEAELWRLPVFAEFVRPALTIEYLKEEPLGG